MRPKVGSVWCLKGSSKPAYKVLRYVSDEKVVCEFDVGFGKQESFPFPWKQLLTGTYWTLGVVELRGEP